MLLAMLGGKKPLDADAAAWAAAVTSAGGTYSAGTLAAVSAFCVSAKANSYWTKLTRINLLCGDQLTAALVPLKVGGGNATDTNNNFVSGDYTEATGLTSNGTTKYLNTGLLANALTANSTHLAVYNRSSSLATGGANRGAIGAFDGTNFFRTFAPETDHTAYDDQYNNGSGRVSAALSTPYGFIVGTRTASNAHALYRNGTSLASNATSAAALPSLAIYVCAFNSSGSATTGGVHPLSAYSIGAGLSSTDVTNFNTDMQVFQTALSRNV